MRMARTRNFFLAFALVALLLGLASVALAKDETDETESDGDFDDMAVGMDDEDPEEAILGEPIPRLKTVDTIESFVNPEGVVVGGGVVGVFGSAEKHADEIREFEEFARPLDSNGYRFALSVQAPEVMQKFGVKEDGWKIFVYPPPTYVSASYGDKTKYRFGGKDITSDTGKASLKAFLLKHYMPLVLRLSPIVGNERMFIERRVPTFIVISPFDETRDPKGAMYIVNRLRKVGQKYRDRMNFAILDSDESASTIYFQKRHFFSDEEDSEKTERIVGIKDGQRYYRMDSAFSVEAAQDFVDRFFKNELKPSSIQEDMVDYPDEDESDEENMNMEL